MATRGAIGRLTNDYLLRFKGRYHHYDSDPQSLGRTLWHLYHDHFHGDLEAMLRFLLDDHPAGWSSLVNADFNLAPGFVAVPNPALDGPQAPACYCHGDRHAAPDAVTQRNALVRGCEFLYLFATDQYNQPTMLIMVPIEDALSKLNDPQTDKAALWEVRTQINLAGPEPDWNGLQG